MKRINVGIIGLGTVGSGVFNILRGNRAVLASRCPVEINVLKVADHNIGSNDKIDIGDVQVVTAEDIFTDPDIDIVVELIGGTTFSRQLVLSALRNGKHVVTANKALLAMYGEEIFKEADSKGLEVGFEASVAGGIPVLKAIREGLAANNIISITGIINGTSNFILTKMSQEGKEFQIVLQEAQTNGYAEADPTFDIEGVDAAHKLLLLVNIAFGAKVQFDQIYSEGITCITPVDIEFAREFGYVIKPLVIAKLVDGELEARVHPAMVPNDYMIANVDGVFNAVLLTGDYVGETLFYGKGAGMEPTGSAVVADIIDISRNMAARREAVPVRVPLLGQLPDKRVDLKVRPIGDIETAYYLRFMVIDAPGVLSKISGLFGKYEISLSKVIQRVRKQDEPVPLVIVTHKSRERQVRRAIDEIARLEVSTMEPVLIRVEGEKL